MGHCIILQNRALVLVHVHVPVGVISLQVDAISRLIQRVFTIDYLPLGPDHFKVNRLGSDWYFKSC